MNITPMGTRDNEHVYSRVKYFPFISRYTYDPARFGFILRIFVMQYIMSVPW